MNQIIRNFSDIDDGKIKKLIARYQNNEEPIAVVIEYLAPIMYSYPLLIAKLDEDSCSDYFEYMLIRMKKILSAYREMDYKFMTWFSVVLRRHYYNWLKSRKDKNIDIPLLNAPINGESGDEMVFFLAYEEYRPTGVYEKIDKLINTLPSREKIILKLHYFNFFKEEDLFELVETFNKDFHTVFKKYHQFLMHIQERENKLYTFQEKLGDTFNRLNKLKEKIESNEIPVEFIEDLKKDMNETEISHKHKLETLKKSFLSLKNNEIAELTGLTVKNAANTLYRGKQILKQKIIDFSLI